MNTLFMIGNGFDLNLGLPTRYKDFYRYYKTIRKDDDRAYIQDFIKNLDNDPNLGVDWSDFELAFGRYAANFNQDNFHDYIALWNDIVDALAIYLAEQANRLSSFVQMTKNNLDYLRFPENFIKEAAREPILKLRERATPTTSRIGIICFNYTDTIEKIYAPAISAIVNTVQHIHGTTNDDMVIGVDNRTQITSEHGLDGLGLIQNRLIKPIANHNTATNRDHHCSELIKEANLICIFGMSLGATDKTWWKQVATRLKSPDTYLVIFINSAKISSRKSYLAVEYIDPKIEDFFDAADVPKEEREFLKNKIHIAFSSPIFGEFRGICSRP